MEEDFDYYDILGLSVNSSTEEIRQMFKKLSVIYHPDKNFNSGATVRFRQIKKAHDTLIDFKQRLEYDNSRKFKKSYKTEPTVKLPEMRLTVIATLEDLMQEKTKKLKLPITEQQDNGELKNVDKLIEVKFNKKMTNGHKITLENAGHKFLACPPLNVVLTVEEKKHDIFKRYGSDIECTITISQRQFSNGTEIMIPTLNKYKICYIVEPNTSKYGSRQITLPQLGFPLPNNSTQQGNLIVNLIEKEENIMKDAYFSTHRKIFFACLIMWGCYHWGFHKGYIEARKIVPATVEKILTSNKTGWFNP